MLSDSILISCEDDFITANAAVIAQL